jgi:FlaG/FlaF family flagellin (archaellin)
MDSSYHEEAVSSVVGEMVLLALAIILVALFAASAFNLLPGGREDVVEVSFLEYDRGTNTITLWHKGGDWVEKNDLTVVIISKEGRNRKEYGDASIFLYNHNDEETGVFDLGGRLKVSLDDDFIPGIGDTVRVFTPKNVIYSGEILEDAP